MSLEEALKQNTEAVLELTKVLIENRQLGDQLLQTVKDSETQVITITEDKTNTIKDVTVNVTEKDEPKKKRGRPAKKEEPKQEESEPKKEEVKEEQTSMFPPEKQEEEQSPPQVVNEPVRMGAAPVVDDSNLPEWYEQTRKRAAMYSRQTGDPTKTQALAASLGIGDLRKASNEQLYNFSVELSKLLGIDVMEAVQ